MSRFSKNQDTSLPQLRQSPLSTRTPEPQLQLVKAPRNTAVQDSPQSEHLITAKLKSDNKTSKMASTNGRLLTYANVQNVNVSFHNYDQFFRMLEEGFNFVNQKSGEDLIQNSDKYCYNFMIVGYSVTRSRVPTHEHRVKLATKNLDLGIVDLMKRLWSAITVEFDVKKKSYNTNQVDVLWQRFSSEKSHLVVATENLFRLLLVLWNGTDLRDRGILARAYEELPFFLEVLDSTYLFPLEDRTNSCAFNVVKSIIGILHNFCYLYDEKKDDMRKKGAAKIVAKFLACQSGKLLLIHVKSALVSAHLITENDDKSSVSLGNDDIKFLIIVLKDAMNGVNYHSSRFGFHADETIRGINQIAVVDSNKQRLVDAGILPLYVRALKATDKSVQLEAVQGIWTLAFDENSKQRINKEPGCMTELKKLTESDDDSIKRTANGALWKIEGESKHIEANKALDSQQKQQQQKQLKHIMISYQWDVKSEVLRFRERLRKEGYRVWIDVEQMSGSTLESMAKAVENSAVFVPVLTEKYKSSPACRQEAEYANTLQKKMVPIRLQPKYRPDGWLGFLLGSTFFYDLTKPREYEPKINEFLKVLAGDGKIQPGEVEMPVINVPPQPSVVDGKSAQSDDTVQYASSMVNVPAYPKSGIDTTKLKCCKWNQTQVTKWLKDSSLDKLCTQFKEFDGKLLAELYAMQNVCPDAYYSFMKDEKKMNLIDVLRLNAALRELA